MSYTDIVTVLMYADDDACGLAQEWLDSMPPTADSFSYLVFRSVLRAA